jgi:hypothetical protein
MIVERTQYSMDEEWRKGLERRPRDSIAPVRASPAANHDTKRSRLSLRRAPRDRGVQHGNANGGARRHGA